MRTAKPGSPTSRLTLKRRRNSPWCEACGWFPPPPLPWTILNAHHVVHRSAGGGDDPDNVAVLCPNCHAMAHAVDRLRPVASKADLLAVLRVLHGRDIDGVSKGVPGPQGTENGRPEGV